MSGKATAIFKNVFEVLWEPCIFQLIEILVYTLNGEANNSLN